VNLRGATWRREHDKDDLAFLREQMEDAGFWAYVDSAATIYHEHRGECPTVEIPYKGEVPVCGDWTHVRGDGCLAARSDREQCFSPTFGVLPFCEFHLGAVWLAMLSVVSTDREQERVRLGASERRMAYDRAQIDIAMVRDARRQMLNASERVYFFAAGEAVKIGRSVNPEKRIKTLAGTKAPEGVDLKSGALLGTVPGGCHVERTLHARFSLHRLVGEWFALDPIRADLLELIAEQSTEEVAA
jgi:hypothetical protein